MVSLDDDLSIVVNRHNQKSFIQVHLNSLALIRRQKVEERLHCFKIHKKLCFQDLVTMTKNVTEEFPLGADYCLGK